MQIKIYMFNYFMKNWILTQMYSTLTIRIDNYRFRIIFISVNIPLCNKASFLAYVAAIYSSSVVDRATISYNWDL